MKIHMGSSNSTTNNNPVDGLAGINVSTSQKSQTDIIVSDKVQDHTGELDETDKEKNGENSKDIDLQADVLSAAVVTEFLGSHAMKHHKSEDIPEARSIASEIETADADSTITNLSADYANIETAEWEPVIPGEAVEIRNQMKVHMGGSNTSQHTDSFKSLDIFSFTTTDISEALGTTTLGSPALDMEPGAVTLGSPAVVTTKIESLVQTEFLGSPGNFTDCGTKETAVVT